MSQSQKKSFAIAITVAVCIVLATVAVIFSQTRPGETFDFIPDTIGPAEVHYSDMEYTRPDSEEIVDLIDSIIDMINNGKSFTEQSKLFTDLNERIINFRTMLILAQIRYYSNSEDEFYKTENEANQLAYVTITDKTDELLDTISTSTYKNNYERTFFGVGYFDDWTPLSGADSSHELLLKETELINKYEELFADPFVTVDGKDIFVYSYEFELLSPEERSAAIDLYKEKYNSLLGEIYVELVKLRLEIAEKNGTDYVSLAYSGMGRDFTPAEADAYIESTKALLSKLYDYSVEGSVYDIPTDTVTSFYHLSLAASKMGGAIENAFDYMVKYGLYDVSASETKMAVSFETFIEKYYAPFMFVSATGTAGDLLEYAHEFGHFTDDYVNLGMGITVDNAEIASQAMSYLVPIYSDGMGDISAEDFLRMNVYSSIEDYYTCIFVHKFESAVYALESDEVTLDKLNSIASDIAVELGYTDYGVDIRSHLWVEIQHIFSSPLYYSAYVISNDVALQVLEAELDNPMEGGIEAFINVLNRDPSLSFVENIEAAGFESPFAEGRVDKIIALLDRIFGVESETAEEVAA